MGSNLTAVEPSDLTVVVGISLLPYERTEHLVVLGTLLLCLRVVAAAALLARGPSAPHWIPSRA